MNKKQKIIFGKWKDFNKEYPIYQIYYVRLAKKFNRDLRRAIREAKSEVIKDVLREQRLTIETLTIMLRAMYRTKSVLKVLPKGKVKKTKKAVGFPINNDFRALYARLLNSMPAFEDAFEVRGQGYDRINFNRYVLDKFKT